MEFGYRRPVATTTCPAAGPTTGRSLPTGRKPPGFRGGERIIPNSADLVTLGLQLGERVVYSSRIGGNDRTCAGTFLLVPG
jgi:hypothetical protein